MKRISIGIFLGILLSCIPLSSFAQSYGNTAGFFYSQAAHNNSYAISQTLEMGYNIDAVDERGNTALCIAMIRNDAQAVRLLRRFGADAQHPCVQSAMSGKSKFALNTGYTVGGVLLAGGAVAAVAAAGGGGGGGSHKSSDNNNGSNSGGNSSGTTGGNSSGTTGGNSSGTTGGNSSGTTGGNSSGTTGGNSSGTTGGNSSGTTGGNSSGTTGGNSSGTTGGNSSGTTGGNSSGTTGGNSSGTTGGNSSGTTGGNSSGTTGGNSSGTTGGNSSGTTGGNSSGTTGGNSSGTTGGNSSGTTGGNSSGTTGGNSSGTTGGNSSGTTGGNDSGTTGGNSSGTTGGNDSGTTGGNDSGTTGGNSSGTTGGNDSGTTGGNTSGTTGGSNTTPTNTLTVLDPSYFETNEYRYGNFLPQINASKAYARFYKKNADGNLVSELQDVIVGIIDTGVYASHNEFASTSISGINRDYGPCRNNDTTSCWVYKSNKAVLYDENGNVAETVNITYSTYSSWASSYPNSYNWTEGDFYPFQGGSYRHGTHVAGIIAADKNGANMHGVAFSNAQILATKWDFISSLNKAMSDTIDAGAKILNMSLGVDANSTMNASTIASYSLYVDSFMLDGVRYARDKNVVMIFSGGNQSYSQPGLYNGIPLLPEFSSTSSLKNLFITVVAVGSSGTIASYSNKCGVASAYCIAAPGGDLLRPIYSTSTYSQSMYANKGTSMAAAVVSGGLALLMGAYPYMTPQQVVELVFETANKDGIYADSNIYGNGLLDLAEATNPQGYLATVSGSDINNPKINTASTKINVPSVFQQPLTQNMPKTMAVFDKYNRPFEISTQNMVRKTHGDYRRFKNDLYNFSRHKEKQKAVSGKWQFGFAPSSFSNDDSGMGFVSTTYDTEDFTTSFFFAEDSRYITDDYQGNAILNPFLSMNEVYGLKNSIHFDDFDFKFAFMTGENGLYDGDSSYHDYDFDNRSYAFDMEAEYPLTENLSFSMVGGMLSEDSALLGMNGEGALNIEDGNTFYGGFLLYWQPIKDLVLSGAYYHGWTEPTHGSGSMLSTSRLLSDSFAFDAHYKYNKTDVLGFQISSPLRIYDGYADFDIAVGRDNYSDEVYRKKIRAGLKPSAREYKFAVYNNFELSDSVMFKSEMAVRLNPDHQSGVAPDYRTMFGLSWSF